MATLGHTGLSVDRLGEMLRQSGHRTACHLRAAWTEPAVEASVYTSRVERIHIDYETGAVGGPASLIAKSPSASERNRTVARLFGLYEREVRFYDELAPQVALATPACLCADFDRRSGGFLLVLEDQAPVPAGDQAAGCDEQQAFLAATDVARLHAAYWEHPALARLTWMPAWNDAYFQGIVRDTLEKAWPRFAERFRRLLPPAALEAGERLPTAMGPLLERLSSPPRTVTHGDYRIDNMFFRPAGDGPPLTVIDWQLSCTGRGAFDVAYLMTQSLAPALRRAHERELLRAYHARLLELDVRGYAFEACWEDYRQAAAYCLVYPVIVASSLDTAENTREAATLEAMVERTASAIVDLDLAETLSRASARADGTR